VETAVASQSGKEDDGEAFRKKMGTGPGSLWLVVRYTISTAMFARRQSADFEKLIRPTTNLLHALSGQAGETSESEPPSRTHPSAGRGSGSTSTYRLISGSPDSRPTSTISEIASW